MRVAFLANSFHLSKTKSADFFIDNLRRFYGEVTVIPHKEAWAQLPGHRWDMIVAWQRQYPAEELEAFHADRTIFVPMYDDTPLTREHWEKYRNFKVFCFSSTLERLLVSYGIRAWGARYYPDPELYASVKRAGGLRGFFWPRTSRVTWDIVKNLMGDAQFDAFDLHWTPDIHGDLKPPADYARDEANGWSVTSWFRDHSEYLAELSKASVFFASRPAEGIGMSFLEAMAMGLCVVAPRGPTMSEYIEDGVTGLLYDIDDPRPLDLSKVEEIGAAARESCRSGRARWLGSMDALRAFIEEPVPGYQKRRHHVIALKGRAIARARIVYRFLKRWRKKF